MIKPLTVLFVILLAPVFTHAQELSVLEVVEQVSQQILADLELERENFAQDPESFYQKLDARLGGVVNFTAIARGVMNRFYRDANDQQRLEFVRIFRRSLVVGYAKVLVATKSKAIQVLPLSEPATTRAQVKMRVETETGDQVMLIYSMAITDERWQIRNIIVEGINLGLTFRNQFASQMTILDGDLDAVIATWIVSGSN